MMRLRKIVMIAAVVFVGLLACFFIFRGTLLQWAFARAQTRMLDSYQIRLTASSVKFTGLSHVVARDITLLPDGADTIAYVREADVNLSLLPLLRGRVAFDGLKVNGASITIYNAPNRNNLRFLHSAKKETVAEVNTSSGYLDRVNGWEAKLFRALNTAIEAKDIQVRYQDTMRRESIFIPSLSYDLHTLSGIVIDQLKSGTISLSGQVIKRKEAYQLTLRQTGSDTVYLPFLDRERGPRCRFRQIDARIDFAEGTITADASAQELHIGHWRLAENDVVMPASHFKGTFHFTDEAVEMDSSSVMILGGASCKVFARYEVRPDTAFALQLHMPEIAADTFFRSLPEGMFNTLKGISCSGTLKYDLEFAIHTNEPDSLLFNSALTQKGLQIRHYGADYYARINAPLTYEAYDKDRIVRTINVGPENPFFTPLDQMSPYLPQAVLQAEDPFFMHHRGFLQESFRESIAKNYKEHRFARGGSTISMQLVKNVYLSRDKTVSRKAEEALIVYLIENLGLVPKERMLEVYLNVIEWGPNIYGIGEASRFYFSKPASALTLQESLFLASIIPRPKAFQYQFDHEGQLRQSLSSYFKILTERMVLRNVLSPADTVGLRPEVTLRGAALRLVVPSDTIPADVEGEE